MLNKVEQESGPALLKARLHDSMLPFANQVRAAANFSLRGCCPLVGREVVNFNINSDGSLTDSFADLQIQVFNSRQLLEAISRELDAKMQSLSNSDSMPFRLSEKAGFSEVSLPADEFISLYIIPNFFFHLAMVYAIARHQGVSLGKQDFDGFHSYPADFSFER
jgi:hypothetical protein